MLGSRSKINKKSKLYVLKDLNMSYVNNMDLTNMYPHKFYKLVETNMYIHNMIAVFPVFYYLYIIKMSRKLCTLRQLYLF